MLRDLIVYGAVLPVLLAAAALVMAWRRRAAPRSATWGGAVGFAAAFAGTQFGLVGRVSLPPSEAWQWTIWLVFAAMVVGIVQSVVECPAWLTWGLRLVVTLFTALLVVPLFHENVTAARVGVAAAVLLLWSVLDWLGERLRGAALPLALLVSAIAAAVVLERSANAKLSHLAGAVAAACGAALLIGIWRPQLSLARGAAAVIAVAIPALLVNGQATTEEVPMLAFGLAALAPLGVALAAAADLRRLSSWRQAATALIGVIVPAGIAVGAAFQATIVESM